VLGPPLKRMGRSRLSRLWTGDTPRIGERFIAAIAIEGFPTEGWPFKTEVHDRVPVAHRFSSRFKS
jgi:type IV secretion system protein TrbE